MNGLRGALAAGQRFAARQRDQIDPGAAAIAGLAAGAAFILTLEAERRLGGRRLDDLLLLGRPFARDRRRARRIGLALHAGNSVGLALLYARFHDRLPGPPWWRGILFANVENTIIYPLTAFDRYHPAIRAGELDRYFTWGAYLQSAPRHIVYGAVAASLYERLRTA